MQPCSRNQGPGLLASLMNVSLVLPLPGEVHILRSSVFWKWYKTRTFAYFWQGTESFVPVTRNHIWTFNSGPNTVFFVHFDFDMCFAPRKHALSTSLPTDMVQTWGALCILTWKRASRKNGVHYLNIWTTSKIVHFNLDMSFAQKGRTLFWPLNSRKCSEAGACCTFLAPHVIPATRACKFSSLIWPGGL